MADSTTGSTNSETQPSESWLEKFKRQWMQTRLAHEGLMIDKIQQQTKRVFALADAARTGTIGKPAEQSDDDMGVAIGNEFHYHGAQTTQASGLGTLGKVAVAASLMAGGAGGAIIASDLLSPDQQAVSSPAFDDNDTLTDVTFPE